MDAHAMQTAASLHIVSSNPKSGATVTGPVDQLRLRFSAPARLLEVTISGPDGDMPTMVDSAEETYEYSIPLPDLGTGRYEARWRASAGGEESSGRLTFSVR
jgi:methionine-rich copper-binding protein CopC